MPSDAAEVLDHLTAALRRSWGPDTCAPEDRPSWHPGNPARGQCITTVLVVHDVLGGSLLRAEVHVDGRHVDYHWWNLLPDGREVDLTREQFDDSERLVGRVDVRRPRDPGRVRDEYDLLRGRVLDASGAGVAPGPS